MTPDAIKYQMMLESQERIRMRTWRPGDDDLDYDDVEYDDAPARPASWSDVAVTPTSRLIVWMLRRQNRPLGAVLAAVLVPAYVAVAYALWQWTTPPDGTALLAVLGIAVALWNAVKFAVAGIACLLRDP